MARSKGILQIEGSLGDTSFYDSVFGPIVRKKGGPSGKLIKTSPKMVRVLEQTKEFGKAAKAAKLFRQGLRLKQRSIWEISITWRVNQLMNAVKTHDGSSVRGERNVDKGFASNAGKALVNNFDIAIKAPLKKVLIRPVSINAGTRTITINQLVASRDIKFPKGASHVRIKGGYARMDFSKEKYELHESPDVVLSLKSKTATNVPLQMGAATLAKGYDFYFILLEFLQQTNAVYYELEDKKYNCMNVLQVV